MPNLSSHVLFDANDFEKLSKQSSPSQRPANCSPDDDVCFPEILCDPGDEKSCDPNWCNPYDGACDPVDDSAPSL